VEDVAKKLGYSQSRTFSQNVRQFFGMSPSEFRTMLSQEDVIAIAREKHLGGRPKHLSIVS
jgi:AraC-like DNA-binding protein